MNICGRAYVVPRVYWITDELKKSIPGVLFHPLSLLAHRIVALVRKNWHAHGPQPTSANYSALTVARSAPHRPPLSWCHTRFLRPKPDAHRMYAQDQVVIHTVRM
jgi:hypothetical protein